MVMLGGYSDVTQYYMEEDSSSQFDAQQVQLPDEYLPKFSGSSYAI